MHRHTTRRERGTPLFRVQRRVIDTRASFFLPRGEFISRRVRGNPGPNRVRNVYS